MNAWLAGRSGFNLLPWRARVIAQARQRRLYECGAALLLGFSCAALSAGWQAWQHRKLDATRTEVEHSLAQLHAPLAERSRLLRDEAERRQRIETATVQSRPLMHLLELLDVLGTARADGIALQQVTHSPHETVLQATVNDEMSADAWLARLRSMHDAQGVSVPELKRTVPTRRPANASDASAPAARASDVASAGAPLQMTVHILWRTGQ